MELLQVFPWSHFMTDVEMVLPSGLRNTPGALFKFFTLLTRRLLGRGVYERGALIGKGCL